MKPSSRSASSATQHKSVRDRVSHWLLLQGDRRVVAVGMTAVVVGLFAGLIASGRLAVGPTSSAASLFGSGLTSGVVTLVTIALSINQLVISRVFDPINNLTDRLQGSRDLRETVEDIADEPSTPNDPAAFLSLIATTMSEAASKLQELGASNDWTPPAETRAVIDDLLAYGESIDDNIERDTRVSDILGVIIGPEYAYNLTAVSHVRQNRAAAMPAVVDAQFEIIEESLESI